MDSVIELDRVSDDPLDPRRRLTVVGRLGPARVIEYAMDAGSRLVAADELRPKAARKGGLKFAAGGN